VEEEDWDQTVLHRDIRANRQSVVRALRGVEEELLYSSKEGSCSRMGKWT